MTLPVRIGLLHYTFWPEFGGVETVMRSQALMLTRKGHEVTVIAGSGANPQEGYSVVIVPELSPDFSLFQEAKKVLDTGQVDHNYNKCRALYTAKLAPLFTNCDIVLVHNILSMHFNLPLTHAVHELAAKTRCIAWTHDLLAANTDYSLPNPTKMPWAMMHASSKYAVYVAASEARAEEIQTHLKPSAAPVVIPNGLDIGNTFQCTPEIRESLPGLYLPQRDYIFLLPSRIMVRKNIEFSIELMKAIRALNSNPLLFITGAHDRYSTAGDRYGKFLRDSLPNELRNHVVFVNDFFPVTDEVMRDLYHLSDCLLFPSNQEGFGLPIFEAALFRLPVWCNNIPAFWAIEGEGSFMINKTAQLTAALEWLEESPSFRLHRRIRMKHDLDQIYEEYYKPLFNITL